MRDLWSSILRDQISGFFHANMHTYIITPRNREPVSSVKPWKKCVSVEKSNRLNNHQSNHYLHKRWISASLSQIHWRGRYRRRVGRGRLHQKGCLPWGLRRTSAAPGRCQSRGRRPGYLYRRPDWKEKLEWYNYNAQEVAWNTCRGFATKLCYSFKHKSCNNHGTLFERAIYTFGAWAIHQTYCNTHQALAQGGLWAEETIWMQMAQAVRKFKCRAGNGHYGNSRLEIE